MGGTTGAGISLLENTGNAMLVHGVGMQWCTALRRMSRCETGCGFVNRAGCVCHDLHFDLGGGGGSHKRDLMAWCPKFNSLLFSCNPTLISYNPTP
jgi:hypothetical protein